MLAVIALVTSLSSAPFFLPKDGDSHAWEIRSKSEGSSTLDRFDTLIMRFTEDSTNHFSMSYEIKGVGIPRQVDQLGCSDDGGCIWYRSVFDSLCIDCGTGLADDLLGRFQQTPPYGGSAGGSGNLAYFLLGLDYLAPVPDRSAPPTPGTNTISASSYTHRVIEFDGHLDTLYEINSWKGQRALPGVSGKHLLVGYGCISAWLGSFSYSSGVDTMMTATRLLPDGWSVSVRQPSRKKSIAKPSRWFMTHQDFVAWCSQNNVSVSKLISFNGREGKGRSGTQKFVVISPEGCFSVTLQRE